MSSTYGDFIKIGHRNKIEQLNLSFNPSSIPLKQRWRNNGLSADFLGDYVTTFYPVDDSDPSAELRQREIKDNLSYAANELLENSMKYTASYSQAMICISVFLFPHQILIYGVNEASAEQFTQLKGVIEELMNNDPADLFLQRMEQDAMGETASGLGLITMMNDYDAELAWHIEPSDNSSVIVTTQVKLTI